jgi:thiopeptide-type bacteriocin biosynthesis protein
VSRSTSALPTISPARPHDTAFTPPHQPFPAGAPELDIRTSVVEGTQDGLHRLLGERGQVTAQVSPRANRLRYVCDENALLRAAHHGSMDLPPWPDLTDRSPDGVLRCLAWLRSVWAVREVADAIRHASPDLSRQLDQLQSVNAAPTQQVHPTALSLAAYLLRLKSRPTPLGLLAGVAPASFGARSFTRLGHRHRAVARAGGAWLADVIGQLEAMDEVRRRLPVMTTNVAVRRGDRLVVPWRPRPTGDTSTTLTETSVPLTSEVRAAIDMAAAPVPYPDLAAKLAAEASHLGLTGVHQVLDQLLEHRVLISSLQPPSTVTDALGHVLEQLDLLHAGEIPRSAGLVAELHTIHRLMRLHGQIPALSGGRLRAGLMRRMARVSAAPRALAVDLRLDADTVLPRSVARDAEAAAAILTRTSADPYGLPAWRRYRDRFVDRYGDRALIPVLDLLDPDVGLGLPDGYLGGPPAPTPTPSARDLRLLALAQTAAADRQREVVLDDRLIAELTIGDVDRMRAPAHLELLLQVQASTREALDRGEYRVIVHDATRGHGTLTGGRLAALLDPAGRDGVPAVLSQLPTSTPSAIRAQLAFPALITRALHITLTPQLLPDVISIAEHRDPGPHVIELSDLAVGTDPDGLFLFSVSRGQRVEAATLHPLQQNFHTPAHARFLDEIARSSSARAAAFDWGTASALPFLPRLRYGRAVLAPARWLLDHAGLPGPGAADAEWEKTFAAARTRLRIPAAVTMTAWDQRLALDLDCPGHRALLRAHLERPFGQHITLTEADTPAQHGWSDDRPCEIAVLLRSTEAARRPSTPHPVSPRRPHTFNESVDRPAAERHLTIRVHARSQTQQSLITTHLPGLVTQLPTATWWFSRRHDAFELHLVPGPENLETAIRAADTWAFQLAEEKVLHRGAVECVAHRPQPAPGEDPRLLPDAEAVLAADSRIAAHLLQDPPGRHDRRVLAAAGSVALAVGLTGSVPAGMRWLRDHATDPEPSPLPRPVLKAAVALADPAGEWAALRAVPGTRDLMNWWALRHNALTAYGDSLRRVAGADLDEVLRDLLGEHVQRIVGPEAGDARACRRLARAVALAHAAREGRR